MTTITHTNKVLQNRFLFVTEFHLVQIHQTAGTSNYISCFCIPELGAITVVIIIAAKIGAQDTFFEILNEKE